MLLPGCIYIAWGPWHFGDFRVKTKKSHHLSAGPLPVTVPYYGISGPSYCITFIKRLDEGLLHYVHKTFRTSTLNFFLVIHFNWLAKIELSGGPGPLVFNIVVNYCCRQKILKETETAGTIGFFVSFLSLVATLVAY